VSAVGTGEGPAQGSAPRRTISGALGRRVVPVAWLVLTWTLLWGTFSWANLLSGLLVAVLVLGLFPLPHVAGSGWLRPWALVRFVAHVVADLVTSSLQVAWLSIRPGPPVRSAVVEVTLETRSEFLMAVIVETLSLVPGSVILESRPAERVIYAHVLGADDEAGIEAFRRQVATVEADLLALVGQRPEHGPVIGGVVR